MIHIRRLLSNRQDSRNGHTVAARIVLRLAETNRAASRVLAEYSNHEHSNKWITFISWTFRVTIQTDGCNHIIIICDVCLIYIIYIYTLHIHRQHPHCLSQPLPYTGEFTKRALNEFVHPAARHRQRATIKLILHLLCSYFGATIAVAVSNHIMIISTMYLLAMVIEVGYSDHRYYTQRAMTLTTNYTNDS